MGFPKTHIEGCMEKISHPAKDLSRRNLMAVMFWVLLS